MRVRTIFGIMLVSGLIATGLLLFPGADDKQQRSEHRVVGYHWIPGAEQSYRLTIATDVRLSLPGSSVQQGIVQRISGTLNMRVFDQEEGWVRVGFQFDQPNYTLNNKPDEILENGLAAPFAVVFDQTGRPLSFQFPEALQKTERIILEESIRTFQVVFPEEKKATWTSAEEHATGHYLARYKVRRDGSIEKKKTRYTEVALSDGDEDPDGGKAEFKQSSSVSRVSAQTAWIHAAVVQESLTLSGGPGFSTESVMRAELESIPVTFDSEESALFRAGKWEDMLLTFTLATQKKEAGGAAKDAVSAAAMSNSREHLIELVAQLNVADKKDRIALLSRIEQVLKGHPDLAYWLIEQIEQPGVSGATDAWLIHILERSGTPQAQEALVMVMDSPAYRTWNRIRAIVALGGVENATDEAIASLVNISQIRDDADTNDMANAALLAVGSIGKTLGESDPWRSDQIRQELSETLLGAGGFIEAGMILKSMGNMGDPALGKTITPYLQNESSFVRSSAARALGRVRGEGSLDLLTDQMTLEQDRVVRVAIIAGMEGMGNATSRSLDTIKGMVLKETEAGARYHMAKYLGDNLAKYPEGRKALQILALKDRSSRVRRYAYMVLHKEP